MNDCSQCMVRNRAICAGLNPDEIAMLGQIGRKQKIAAGQSLIWEGDESLIVANVIDGVFKLSANDADGREQIVGLVFPSDFVGRPFGGESPYNVTALTDGEVCTFARSAFNEFASAHPSLEHKLLHRTIDELDNARKWIQLLGRKSAEGKIATFLLVMAKQLPGKGCDAAFFTDVFTLPFGRQQIADVLGLTIETVSRQLTQMKNDRLIELPSRREIILLDRERLEQMAA